MVEALIAAIGQGDFDRARELLGAQPDLAKASLAEGATRRRPDVFFPRIGHYAYEGDTALHLAAAAHEPELVARLIGMGADVAARNRRKAQSLHYAVDGNPRWRLDDQATVVDLLIAAGADPNAVDAGGVTPLHRAVRNRCGEAVAALLNRGADPRARNKAGSTPMRLAEVTSGRGGSGSPQAKAQQETIVALLERALRQT